MACARWLRPLPSRVRASISDTRTIATSTAAWTTNSAVDAGRACVCPRSQRRDVSGGAPRRLSSSTQAPHDTRGRSRALYLALPSVL
ncbi:hypothetical protein C8Q76DRAFT_736913 [Earliella scabrosa]|nr:hypothetical protein C8Q76DRAFT_736913 [Earliella scabrosa]